MRENLLLCCWARTASKLVLTLRVEVRNTKWWKKLQTNWEIVRIYADYVE